MPTRITLLLVLAWVVADFSNPLMPGAVSFDAGPFVEAVESVRVRAPSPGALAFPALPPRPVSLPSSVTTEPLAAGELHTSPRARPRIWRVMSGERGATRALDDD
jgi:hypothetical protein